MRGGMKQAGTEGRRERNKQRVKERIFTAALDLFTENGYDGTTIDDITVRADVARGTFFNYFQRKEDLIAEWAERRRQTMVDRLQLPLSLDTTDAATLLQLCMAVLAKVNEEQQAVTETMLTAWVRAGLPLYGTPYTATVFAGIVQAGIESGELDPRVDPELAGDLLRDAYIGAIYRWSRGPREPGTLNRNLRDILDIVLHGMAGPA